MPKPKAPTKPAPTNPDPEGFEVRLDAWCRWMQTRNYSPHTISGARRNVGYFIDWCAARDLHRPGQITRPILEAYARSLFEYRKASGEPLKIRGQYLRLQTLRTFFHFLVRRNVVLFSPAHELELPRLNYQLPRAVLSHEEMELVLAQPDTATDQGVRDRAIIETFYSTGMRRSELANLEIQDLDVGRGVLAIREGKGKKDRFVPIGERAIDWIDRYLRTVRPRHVRDVNRRTLFVTAYGEPLSIGGLTHHMAEYVDAANLGKKGSCHLFRHTMATAMLERGADVRLIQEILGHSKTSSTQVYTHVAIRQLVEVHARTHPAAKRDLEPTVP